MSKRLNASERARARRYAANLSLTGEVPDDPKRRLSRYDITPPEPALGSLAERLSILIVRHGGRLRVGKPSAEEVASVTRYDVVPGPRGGFAEQLELAAWDTDHDPVGYAAPGESVTSP